MTEDELVGIHKVDRTASDWPSILYTRCQIRLPTKTAQWRQFKATFEFKRKASKDCLAIPFPTKLRSCRAGNSSFIRPQKLGESVTYVAEEPEEPAPEELVSEACTFCLHSFLLQISTHSPPSRWQETTSCGETSDRRLWKDIKVSQDQHHTSHSSCCPQSQGARGASGWICCGSHVRTDDDTHARMRH